MFDLGFILLCKSCITGLLHSNCRLKLVECMHILLSSYFLFLKFFKLKVLMAPPSCQVILWTTKFNWLIKCFVLVFYRVRTLHFHMDIKSYQLKWRRRETSILSQFELQSVREWNLSNQVGEQRVALCAPRRGQQRSEGNHLCNVNSTGTQLDAAALWQISTGAHEKVT